MAVLRKSSNQPIISKGESTDEKFLVKSIPSTSFKVVKPVTNK